MAKFSRREFLKTSGLAAGAAALGSGCADSGRVEKDLRTAGCTVSPTVCPYCAVGCGMRVYTRSGRAVHIDGDPDHPINEGTLCSKGAASLELIENSRRLKHVLYRPPGGKRWERKSWSWALDRMARRIKKTRDATFEERDRKGRTVNRTAAIAHLGGAAHSNEECYLLAKMLRALGLVYLEHQARI